MDGPARRTVVSSAIPTPDPLSRTNSAPEFPLKNIETIPSSSPTEKAQVAFDIPTGDIDEPIVGFFPDDSAASDVGSTAFNSRQLKLPTQRSASRALSKKSLVTQSMANMKAPADRKERQSGQVHEDDPAKVILVHGPDLPIFMGTLHPNGSLYENAVNLAKAKQEHQHLVDVLRKNNITVHRIRDVLQEGCEEDLTKRLLLERLALECLSYQYDKNDPNGQQVLSRDDEYMMSDEYKAQVLSQMSVDQLTDVILCNPTIYLRKADINTSLTSSSITFNPLSNLVFCRDQQISTLKGIVLGQLNSSTRAEEIEITKFCFSKLGLKVIGEISLPGKLEGGDFFPLGKELCFIGIGMRTNMKAVHYCMDHDCFGTEYVAVVKDCFDWNQERMHLDTIFNIVDSKNVVLLETVIGAESHIRRLVDVYHRVGEGAYELVQHDIEFSIFLKSRGFHIIPLSQKDHANYGLNFLNIGNGHLICCDERSARKIARDPNVTGQIEVIEYHNITTMYGALHCSTQVLVRSADNAKHQAPFKAVEQAQCHGSPKPVKQQSTNSVLIVPPTAFFFNPLAAEDNTFMNAPKVATRSDIQKAALHNFSHFHQVLSEAGVQIHCAINARQDAPDSVYPNNWFSTHSTAETGQSEPILVLYPMKPENRRYERTEETIRRLTQFYTKVIDLTYAESQEEPVFLEGTGALVLDRVNKVAYMAESQRADSGLAAVWAEKLGYELVDFGECIDSLDEKGVVYHTNVMMSVCTKVAVVCTSSVKNPEKRELLKQKLSKTHVIIDITFEQMTHFCGNVIEVRGKDGLYLAMSQNAYDHFTVEQLNVMKTNDITPLCADIPNIEKFGGGGVRCCIAELF